MEISEKTVEAHISKALKILRVEMKDYIALALLFLPAI
jgi:DNA-binding CsgD family transcriptional regulator